MRKRLLSVFMVQALIITMAQAAFAVDGQAATITAYTSDGTAVAGTYTTIDAAVNAAGENGRVVISEGTLAVNGRQTISKAGVTVEGAGRAKTFLVTSDSFKNGSETNRKALLTIAADNVTVEGMTIDGSTYGDTLDMSGLFSFKDFVVVRVNSGSNVKLYDLYITGSPKTLIQLGNGTTPAIVTADELYCQGVAKAVNLTAMYPDIDFANTDSRLTVNSGALHAFISDVGESSCYVGINCEPVFTLIHTALFQPNEYLHSTFQHYANMYVAMKDDLTILTGSYANDLANTANQETITGMVEQAKATVSSDPASVQNFVTLLNDASEEASGDYAQTLSNYADELSAMLAASES